MKKETVACPFCGELGSVDITLLGQGVMCAGCNRDFLAKRLPFWQRQKVNSPLLNSSIGFFAALGLALAFRLGLISFGVAVALAVIVLLTLILRQLTAIARK